MSELENYNWKYNIEIENINKMTRLSWIKNSSSFKNIFVADMQRGYKKGIIRVIDNHQT